MSEYPLTVSSLITEVQSVVRGYTQGTDQATSLVVDLDDVSLGFSVDNGQLLSQGVVEIDDELMQVRLARAHDGYCETEPWGRGINNSVAAPHSVGAKVTMAPLYPRVRIRDTLAATLREIFPDVYAVGNITLTTDAVTVGYVLPDDVWRVLSVSALQVGPGNTSLPVRSWSCDQADSAVLSVWSSVPPGPGRLRVQYIKTPPADLSGDLDLADYGYDASIRDLLVLGATAKLLAFTESARVNVETVESAAKSTTVAPGSAIALSRMLYQMFQKRVDDERRQLLLRYPPQFHRVR